MTSLHIPDETRKWIYNVALVALPLLVLYGAINEADVPLWTALLGALLVAAPVGIARSNWVRTDHAAVVDGTVVDTDAPPV